ncbi:MAG: anti-sigma factor [Lewinellaceae bacterium]|nr:anti-sigma factor [Phaeodactylibacter sp.]MCB9037573.1 anti-sigma factor [Lewinellaceae bacterium]
MDIKAYISSGILEQYVLGKLPPQEEAEVEQNAEKHPEIRQELNAIEVALEEYALLHGRMPPPGVLSAILQRLRAEQKISGQPSSRRLRLLAYAAGLLLLGALAGLLVLYQAARQQRAAIAGLNQQIDSIQQSCDSVQAVAQRLENTLDFVRQPATRAIAMESTGLSPDAVATVFYNPDTRRSLIGVGQLPVPASDKQYQLWAITGAGPVSMGVFELPAAGQPLQEVVFVADAQAFAVTLEQRGGSPVPTLDQMYVLGNNS